MKKVLLVVALVSSLLVAATPVSAQEPSPEPTEEPVEPTITLRASDERVTFGKKVTFRGRVDPATPDEEVELLDQDGKVIASVPQDETGRYEAIVSPRRNLEVTARWTVVTSEPVVVRLIPIVKSNLNKVRLFGKAVARGNVRPALPGAKILLKLKNNGKAARSKTVSLKKGRFFKTRFKINKVGSHRVLAVVKSDAVTGGRAASSAAKTPLPNLSVGTKNPFVKLLEKRLRQLGYYLPGADQSFDVKTRDALIAFNKVQRTARVGHVDQGTWRRLASPIKPKPRFKSDYHFEIDQTRQVIFIVKKSKVRWIIHTSTGAGGATRNGKFTVHRQLAGYSPNRLYYPSYWDGLRAFHGWPEVPTYNASRGCARVPMWLAIWLYERTPMGATVHIYH